MWVARDEALHYHEESSLIHSHGYTGHHEHSVKEELIAPKPLSLVGLILLVYFIMVSPFGIEAGVGAAGPLVFLGALMAIALLWSAPQAIVGAELSLRFGQNGGSIVWVQEAFGATSFMSFFNTCNLLCCSSFNYALQIVVCVDYINSLVPLSNWAQWGCRFGLVLLAGLINVGGAHWISRLNAPLLILVLAPFFALFFYGNLGDASTWATFAAVPSDFTVQIGPFISVVVWAFGGADVIGALAGDLGPKRLVQGIAIAFPLCLSSFALAVVAAWGISSDLSIWRNGGFVAIAWHAAPWLGGCMVAAACLSCLGQFISSLAAMARFVWATAQPGPGQMLPTVLGRTWVDQSRMAHPLPAIALSAALCLACCALPFELAVQIFTLQRSISLYCMYAAYVKLRTSEDSAASPLESAFRLPGGRFVAVLITLPTVAISIVSMVFVSDGLVWIVAGAIEGAVILAFLASKTHEYWPQVGQALWKSLCCVGSSGDLYKPVGESVQK